MKKWVFAQNWLAGTWTREKITKSRPVPGVCNNPIGKSQMTNPGHHTSNRGWKMSLREIFADRRRARPWVAVVIPVLNAAEKLQRSIESVLREPEEMRELWVVDGGSKDGTQDVLRQYNGQVNWISENDQGVYDAMNKGIARTAAPYLYFLGAGDTLRSGMLRKAAAAAPRRAAGFVYGNVFMQDKNVVWDGPWTAMKFRTRTPCQQAIFYDRRIFEWHGGFEPRFKALGDYAMNIRCFGDKRVRKVYMEDVIADYEGAGYSANYRDEAFYEARPELLRRHLGLEAKVKKRKV
jgi:glycosyltransferase involved in cell wall biosynthesis